MDDENDSAVLEAHVGTRSPCWRLGSDSNALELAAVRGMTNIGVALTADQAARIRALTGVTSHLVLDIVLFGHPVALHLVGRKVNTTDWAGTASAYSDTVSVAGDLAHGLAFAEQVVSEVNSLVVILDRNGMVQRFNRLCEEVTGKREVDVIGRSAFELFMNPEQGAQSRSNITGFFASNQAFAVERYINTVNGPRLFQFRNKFVQSGSGVDEQFLICSGIDITEERNAQQRLIELANTDVLTGLPNRHAISERIHAVIAEQGRDKPGQVGILFLDLDNFKRVNDHYGHITGDRLLQDVSAIISGCLPSGATLARLGGDEFLVLFENGTRALLEATAQIILERLRTPIHLGLMEVYTSCSIGIAMHPQHGDSLETLIRNADTAMYVAKEAGKHTYRVFSLEMNQRVAKYMWLDTNLRKALEEEQFVLHYQPVVDIATGDVQAVEALIRWQSPDRGLVAPVEFIRFAEESGLIAPLGRWVMRTAAAQAAAWKAKGLGVRIAVNVSARQLQDMNIVHQFASILDGAGLKPGLLDIELTESCFIEDEDAAHGLMKQFRQLGAKVHLDDFGTGYSSLSQLSRLPLDAIKLDRSFITGIDRNPRSQALVRSVVSLANALNFSVIAEGVETHEEAGFLKQIDVGHAQGYYYARPMPAQAFEAWLAETRKLRLIA
ncbi:cyclic di-GMP phosphodiesterase [Burkholderia pseudomultivorans]|uniref:Cyclic di-GMP phosphodiesterase PdeR n=1 Tax=Burkholderia pseudomultivorans TaxID=1207504 RepID=A0ABU2EAR4_9BURK|nr:cyclic di-GMP phosphodiesterase [Burkholderia pseudomultivorans]MDR8729477.1 Cyclic di-GMP phosphodiesterase PdeR [Burkholderia pseudomultivorans]MDR8737357.1 Cyclic di-GMP phosphodiesterase PdeR [Burkholderia pseudomultivorans]MDR8743401.1 Cyclic di-GMP phosphodiesterase PdeR [Burkholderia pseudomultivorans]MDR8756986.1 Cyclic di-GMP phosphodiesterase PdeR [Burkholderia pseudomultivorans]MDR8780020.1 Cyclic di-GMP phosphodiesterase PdeR [Burkholderia pseudomultivorans]